MNTDSCMVDVTKYFLEFTQKESCGGCVPCRLGTKQMLDILDDITKGKGNIDGICVRTCDEIAGVHAIDFSQRGYSTQISTFGDNRLVDSRCVSCGECLMRCPTGALSIKERRGISKLFETICPYCGCGCSLLLGVRGNKIISVVGNRNGPVNKGRLCVKGRFGLTFPNHPDRLTTPLVRGNGKLTPTSWDKALNLVSSKFKKFKGDQFAVFTSAKCTNEENYMIQKIYQSRNGHKQYRPLCQAVTFSNCGRSCPEFWKRCHDKFN